MDAEKRELKYISPEELTPYYNNPRENKLAIHKVVESIKEFTFTQPILVDENLEILAGHTRREAAIILEMDVIPYVVIEGLTEAQKKAYRIADNKLSEYAIWDEDLLKQELDALAEEDYDLTLTGFTDVDLENLLAEDDLDEDLPDLDDGSTPKEEKTTLPMLRFGSNSVRITQDELIMLSNRYNEYVEAEPGEGFVTWLLKRGI